MILTVQVVLVHQIYVIKNKPLLSKVYPNRNFEDIK